MTFDRDSQKQENSGGGVAIQAGGDVHNGLSFSEVKEICQLYMQNNFPILRQEALDLSKQHVEDFGERLMQRLSKQVSAEFEHRLGSPDVQSSINDAVMQVAKKTEHSNSELLLELIDEKIRVEPAQDASLILTESIMATGKLNGAHIKLLSLIYLLRHTEYCGAQKGKGGIRSAHNAEIKRLFDFENVCAINKDYMAYTGSIAVEKHYVNSLLKIMSDRCGIGCGEGFENKDIRENVEILSEMPLLRYGILQLGFSTVKDFDAMVLTQIGQCVAKCYLKSLGFFILRPWQNNYF